MIYSENWLCHMCVSILQVHTYDITIYVRVWGGTSRGPRDKEFCAPFSLHSMANVCLGSICSFHLPVHAFLPFEVSDPYSFPLAQDGIQAFIPGLPVGFIFLREFPIYVITDMYFYVHLYYVNLSEQQKNLEEGCVCINFFI